MSSRLSVAHGEISRSHVGDLSTTLEMTKGGGEMTRRGIVINHLNLKRMTKKETVKFVIQLIASIASAILTALGATSCVGA